MFAALATGTVGQIVSMGKRLFIRTSVLANHSKTIPLNDAPLTVTKTARSRVGQGGRNVTKLAAPGSKNAQELSKGFLNDLLTDQFLVNDEIFSLLKYF